MRDLLALGLAPGVCEDNTLQIKDWQWTAVLISHLERQYTL